jgi:murein DD-endopeptidase MepM/ murein hydrolase activator NlpD
MWGNRGERREGRTSRIIRVVAVASALTLVFTGTLQAVTTDAAFAKDYPSWNDVVKARNSEAATKKEITRIRSLLAALRTEVEETQQEAQEKGELYQLADQKFQEQALKTEELQSQATEAAELAAESKKRAGEMIAQQYRSGNGDVTTNLFLNATKADDLLYSYGMADKFTQQTSGIYEKAMLDQNSAQALTDQAAIAKTLLEELKVEAEKAFAVAQEAAEKAATALAEQEERQSLLTAQLAVLVERRKVTEKDYLKGVRESQGSGAGLGAGQISASGWARPSAGRITSSFGWRAYPAGYHLGTDLGAGCGGNEYAAHSGTVSYAGWNGVYGYFIRIDHGGGVQTEYGHIMAGGIKVRIGQSVGVGTLIAKAGATGGATGCHLHFGVRINGLVTDPVPFMRNQGITLG